MKTIIKKHWIAFVGVVVILTGLAIAIIQHLRPGMICVLIGLVILLIDMLINNDDKVQVSTPQSDTSLRDSDTAQVPTAQDAKGAKLTGVDIVRLAILAVAVAVLIVLCITRPECLMMLGVTLVLTILFLIAMSDDSGCGCLFVILIFIGLLLRCCS
jgi:hypothetical protein